MAPALIRAQIPAVIAMQFKVLDAAAQAFAGEFYRALAEGFPIDACVTEGRKAVMGAVGLSRADWGIPVVYTRAPDGKLFELPAAPALTAQTSERLATTSAAPNAGDERAERIEELRELMRANRRALYELEKQKATMGTYTPPYISIGIKDAEREIAELERKLKELGE
jgi:hypothetical protein